MRTHSSAMSRAESSRIPGQAPECVPVGLIELRAGPVAHRRRYSTPPRHAIESTLGDRSSPRPCEGVEAQHFLVERTEIHQMSGEAQVFLGDLHLQHHAASSAWRRTADGRARAAENRWDRSSPAAERSPRIFRRAAGIHRRPACPICILVCRIHECAPHHDAAVRRQCGGEHIGAIGMRAAVILRTWLAFGIGLDEKAAEVRNVSVDLIHFIPPPESAPLHQADPHFSNRRSRWAR